MKIACGLGTIGRVRDEDKELHRWSGCTWSSCNWSLARIKGGVSISLSERKIRADVAWHRIRGGLSVNAPMERENGWVEGSDRAATHTRRRGRGTNAGPMSHLERLPASLVVAEESATIPGSW